MTPPHPEAEPRRRELNYAPIVAVVGESDAAVHEAFVSLLRHEAMLYLNRKEQESTYGLPSEQAEALLATRKTTGDLLTALAKLDERTRGNLSLQLSTTLLRSELTVPDYAEKGELVIRTLMALQVAAEAEIERCYPGGRARPGRPSDHLLQDFVTTICEIIEAHRGTRITHSPRKDGVYEDGHPQSADGKAIAEFIRSVDPSVGGRQISTAIEAYQKKRSVPGKLSGQKQSEE